MKKEEFKQAIDNIQPDIHMKTRLQAKISDSKNACIKKHKFSKSIAALCLAAAVIFSAVMFAEPQLPDGGESSRTSMQSFVPQIMKAFIVVASAAEENEEAEEVNKTLELNEEYPYGVHLKVADIRALSEVEKEDLLDQLNNELAKYCSSGSFSMGMSMTCGTENFYLSQCSINEFRLDLEDAENIKAVNVTNTSVYGYMVYDSHKPTFNRPEYGHSITISGDEFDCETAGFYWDHTEEMEKALHENPDIPFSAFNDTITFTVEYNDGTKAVGVVDLEFDSAGSATAICKSYEYTKAGDSTK